MLTNHKYFLLCFSIEDLFLLVFYFQNFLDLSYNHLHNLFSYSCQCVILRVPNQSLLNSSNVSSIFEPITHLTSCNSTFALSALPPRTTKKRDKFCVFCIVKNKNFRDIIVILQFNKGYENCS